MTSVWVFDIDDTLYLERDYVRSGFNAVGAWAKETMEIDGLGDHAWDLFLGGTRNTTLTDAFGDFGRNLTDAETSTMVAVYRDHNPVINLCGDARSALERLSQSSRTAVITDGPATSQRAKVLALGLNAFAHPVVLTEEHGEAWRKPGAHAFAYIESVLGVAPEECAYVADNPRKDFSAPKRRGWQTIRITRPGGLHAAVPSAPGEVDLDITSLYELGRHHLLNRGSNA